MASRRSASSLLTREENLKLHRRFLRTTSRAMETKRGRTNSILVLRAPIMRQGKILTALWTNRAQLRPLPAQTRSTSLRSDSFHGFPRTRLQCEPQSMVWAGSATTCSICRREEIHRSKCWGPISCGRRLWRRSDCTARTRQKVYTD